jgi:hypothetical protein
MAESGRVLLIGIEPRYARALREACTARGLTTLEERLESLSPVDRTVLCVASFSPDRETIADLRRIMSKLGRLSRRRAGSQYR